MWLEGVWGLEVHVSHDWRKLRRRNQDRVLLQVSFWQVGGGPFP